MRILSWAVTDKVYEQMDMDGNSDTILLYLVKYCKIEL